MNNITWVEKPQKMNDGYITSFLLFVVGKSASESWNSPNDKKRNRKSANLVFIYIVFDVIIAQRRLLLGTDPAILKTQLHLPPGKKKIK
jgi:hypothetical protein